MTQLTIVLQKLKQHGFLDGEKQSPSICNCEHRLQGTGAVFLQSLELLVCNECKGWQLIRKVIR